MSPREREAREHRPSLSLLREICFVPQTSFFFRLFFFPFFALGLLLRRRLHCSHNKKEKGNSC